MPPFFEIRKDDIVNDHLMAAWGMQDSPIPVNTDYPQGVDAPKIVIVCESPSVDEVRDGRPVSGSTGNRLTAAIRQREGPGRRQFDRDDYPAKGYYLTNLVRYRADEPQGAPDQRLSRSETDKRLIRAWNTTGVSCQIRAELLRLKEAVGELPILFACGSRRLLGGVFEQLTGSAFGHTRWLYTKHPSRWRTDHYSLVDDSQWSQMVLSGTDGIYRHSLAIGAAASRRQLN